MAKILSSGYKNPFLPSFGEDEDENDILGVKKGIPGATGQPQPQPFSGEKTRKLGDGKEVFQTGDIPKTRTTPQGDPDTPDSITPETPEVTLNEDGTPKSRDFGATAIVSLIAAAASTAAAAGSSASSTAAAEEEGQKARAESRRQFDEQMKAEERAQNMKGLEFLERGRERAVARGRQRPGASNFQRDLLSAMGGV